MESTLTTVQIKNAHNGYFMAAASTARARVSCTAGAPIILHQKTDSEGAVQFQVVDRHLVDQSLFLAYSPHTASLQLQTTNWQAKFKIGKTQHHYCTLETEAHPGSYIVLNNDNSLSIKKNVPSSDNRAQWTLQESEFPLQPIFAFGHVCNDLKYVKETLDRGGNAIECDIDVQNPEERHASYDFVVTHSEFALSYGGGKTPLKDYLLGLVHYLPRLAAIMFDCKQADNVDYAKYGNDLAEAIANAGISPDRCIISVPRPECRDMLTASALVEKGFQRDVSMIDLQPLRNEQNKWLRTAEEMGCNWLGMGITNLAPLPTRSWFSLLQHSVANKGRQGKVPKVYFWTLDSRTKMRKVLQTGVDGIICDLNALFHCGLPSMKGLLECDLTRRMATSSDSLAQSFDAGVIQQ